MTAARPTSLRALWRPALGWLLIAGVCAVLIRLGLDRDHPVHPFPWYHKTSYELHPQIDGHPLTSRQIRLRYGLPVRGHTHLTPAGLRAVVRAREARRGRHGATFVRLRVREDGGPETVWLWPEP